MKTKSFRAIGLSVVLLPAIANANSIILDGTFLNPIGFSFYLTPWSDWTSAGITRNAAPNGIPGNYASLSNGADLFQWFNTLRNGEYLLSFKVQNASPWPTHLVFAIQQRFGSPVDTEISLGLLKDLELPASNGGFRTETLHFEVDNPPYALNEFTFSNSYDQPLPGIEDSVNPDGSIINVADVSLRALSLAPEPTYERPISSVPETSTWVMMLLGFTGLGLFKLEFTRRRKTIEENNL